jgi:hypothetical protein
MKTEDIDKKIGMPDVDTEWAKFESEIIDKESKPRWRSVYTLGAGLAIAASLLLFFVLNMERKVTDDTPIVAEQMVNPTISDTNKVTTTDTIADTPAPVMKQQKIAHPEEAKSQKLIADVTKDKTAQPAESHAVEAEKTDTKVFSSVEQSASFHGGTKACMAFIEENLRIPELATTYGVKGRIITSFLVEKNGELSDIKVVRCRFSCDSTRLSQMSDAEQAQLKEQLSQQLSEEAVRVVSIMPRWLPAKMNGEAMQQKYTLPIRFNQ